MRFSSKLPNHTNHLSIKLVSIFLSKPEIIANHTIKNKIHKNFLNKDFGELAHLSFATNFWPKSAIPKSITHNQNA